MSPVSPDQIQAYRHEYPELPEGYFKYLESIGAGNSASGWKVYDGPLWLDEIFPHADFARVVLLGDDYQGYFFGFDLDKLQYGEVTPEGIWELSDTPKEFTTCES